MKRILIALDLAGSLLTAGSAVAAERTVTPAVDNVHCNLCPGIVKKSLAKVDDVTQVGVSFEKETATFTCDDKKDDACRPHRDDDAG